MGVNYEPLIPKNMTNIFNSETQIYCRLIFRAWKDHRDLLDKDEVHFCASYMYMCEMFCCGAADPIIAYPLRMTPAVPVRAPVKDGATLPEYSLQKLPKVQRSEAAAKTAQTDS